MTPGQRREFEERNAPRGLDEGQGRGADLHEVLVDLTRERGLTLPAMKWFFYFGRGRADVEIGDESPAAVRI